jgi:transketolase
MPLKPLMEKWQAFGWQAYEADGHDWDSLYANLSAAQCVKGKPSIVIAYTVKGKGVSFAEGVTQWHAGAPTQEQFEVAFRDLSEEVYYQRLKGGKANG